jgi:hypothetical protein
MNEFAHMRVYRFEPGAAFEGGLLTAVERMQVGGGAKLLDALFVRRGEASDELDAVDLAAGGADATLASLLDFRLDPARRRSITERTLAEHPGGVPRPLIEAIAATLQPGAAVLAILHRGDTVTVLEDAVARMRGRLIAAQPADARTLAELGPRLRLAVGSR